MFTSNSGNARAYAKVGLETDVISANPHRLVAMLFDGAQFAIRTATLHIKQNDIAAKGAAISRAIDIIGSGLQASLDLEHGGEMAQRLDALYTYMVKQLLAANLQSRVETLEEVSRLLDTLQQAWKQIGSNPKSASTHQADTVTLAA